MTQIEGAIGFLLNPHSHTHPGNGIFLTIFEADFLLFPVPIFSLRNLRAGEVKELVQGYLARSQQSWDLNQNEISDPRLEPFPAATASYSLSWSCPIC